MTIKEMHKLFRVLGQQMGIQQVRGILPESIDAYLNDSIITKVRTILQENCTVDFKNRIAIQRSEISPVNALRTLYYESIKDKATNVLVYLGAYLQIKSESDDSSNITKRYNCRLIDPIELDNTLNDYCNRPTLDCPILIITNSYDDTSKSFALKFNIFTGEETDSNKYDIYLKYIVKPAIVDYNKSVDCDIPEYLHTEIVENAVQKYFISMGYTSRPATTNETT